MDNLTDDTCKISQLLLDGKIVLCPTDTIWGLSCCSLLEDSVEKIYSIKKRNRQKPLILLVSNLQMLKDYIVDLHPRVENLLALYQKPLTIIHQAGSHLPHYLVGTDNSIAIRITTDRVLQKLIGKINQPLVSTSANLEGEPSPGCYADIEESIKNKVDYIFLSGRNTIPDNQSSTIIKYTEEGELIFLR